MNEDAPAAVDMIPEKGIVLFSGGQDSTTCLAWALEHFAAVETVGFDYRQRHRAILVNETAPHDAHGRQHHPPPGTDWQLY